MDHPLIVRSIIQMAGAPKGYIEQTLARYLEKLESDGLRIKSKDIAEATENSGLFSCFAEIVAEYKSVEDVMDFCFSSMPSSVEILEPDELTLKSFDFSNVLNELQVRLHALDMQVKQFKSASELLDLNGLELIRNFIAFSVKGHPRTIEEISPIVGVNPEELKPFLDKMVEENRLSVKEGTYFVE